MLWTPLPGRPRCPSCGGCWGGLGISCDGQVVKLLPALLLQQQQQQQAAASARDPQLQQLKAKGAVLLQHQRLQEKHKRYVLQQLQQQLQQQPQQQRRHRQRHRHHSREPPRPSPLLEPASAPPPLRISAEEKAAVPAAAVAAAAAAATAAAAADDCLHRTCDCPVGLYAEAGRFWPSAAARSAASASAAAAAEAAAAAAKAREAGSQSSWQDEIHKAAAAAADAIEFAAQASSGDLCSSLPSRLSMAAAAGGARSSSSSSSSSSVRWGMGSDPQSNLAEANAIALLAMGNAAAAAALLDKDTAALLSHLVLVLQPPLLQSRALLPLLQLLSHLRDLWLCDFMRPEEEGAAAASPGVFSPPWQQQQQQQLLQQQQQRQQHTRHWDPRRDPREGIGGLRCLLQPLLSRRARQLMAVLFQTAHCGLVKET
ncbi:hypothetical protein ETH_00014125 [Eimeria tenella]|uniref:Uncharacterized protein n=1 Tax=Eimeria tenella TaxID=5802 RepID=U6L7Q7_EIMTE|nr:hypothetical protein ETH_00014125 [Eimeria tenella]CDJ45248.1 hypothetical protein ETH_00014125 [Eimeria tenella]|eukprot:XP_013235995.1 hypothetical protein ETH_00014125 [Eimeria tenella]